MPDELVTITSYPNAAEAEVARSALEEEGIRSYLADEGLVSNVWLLGNAVGYVKLQVAAGDIERAKAILLATDAEWPSDDGSRAADDEEEEARSEATALGDEEARRAWRAAIFGVLFCPPLLNLYSVYVLLNLGGSDLPLSSRGHRHVASAIVVNLLVLVIVFVLATNLFHP